MHRLDQLTELNMDRAAAIEAKASAQASVDAGEAKLSELRSKTSQNAERAIQGASLHGISPFAVFGLHISTDI